MEVGVPQLQGDVSPVTATVQQVAQQINSPGVDLESWSCKIKQVSKDLI